MSEVTINRRTINQIKTQFRKHVNQKQKDNKYRRGYKFIYYAIYLIYEDFIVNYLVDRILISQSNNIIGNVDNMVDAIDNFNVGKRIDNTNRSTGIDSIDKGSLIKGFDIIMLTFNDNLINIKNNLLGK